MKALIPILKILQIDNTLVVYVESGERRTVVPYYRFTDLKPRLFVGEVCVVTVHDIDRSYV